MGDRSGLGSTPGEVTLEEWADWPEDKPGEVVDGRVVEEEMPGFAHGLIVISLEASRERVDAVPGCSGLVLDLPALWREVDALESGDA